MKRCSIKPGSARKYKGSLVSKWGETVCFVHAWTAEACESRNDSWPGGLEGEQLEYQCCITSGSLIQKHNLPHYQEISERISSILPFVREENNFSTYYNWLQDQSALITCILQEVVFERFWNVVFHIIWVSLELGKVAILFTNHCVV